MFEASAEPEVEATSPYKVFGSFVGKMKSSLTETASAGLSIVRRKVEPIVKVAKDPKEAFDGFSPRKKAVTFGLTATGAVVAAPSAVGLLCGVNTLGPISGGLCATLQSAGWTGVASYMQSVSMIAVPTTVSTGAGAGVLATCVSYLAGEKRFKPDLSNTERRSAGVSEKMSKEAQGLITRFDKKIDDNEDDPAIKMTLKRHRSTLQNVKHARTSDPNRNSTNPFFTGDPKDDEKRAYEAWNVADAYLKIQDDDDDINFLETSSAVNNKKGKKQRTVKKAAKEASEATTPDISKHADEKKGNLLSSEEEKKFEEGIFQLLTESWQSHGRLCNDLLKLTSRNHPSKARRKQIFDTLAKKGIIVWGHRRKNDNVMFELDDITSFEGFQAAWYLKLGTGVEKPDKPSI